MDAVQPIPISARNVNLPSGCLIYEGVDPSKIMIRPLKGKDEKLMAEITFENVEKKFLTLLQNVMYGIDPLKLTTGDRNFVLIWLAINSYGSEYPVQTRCDECSDKINLKVNLSEMEIATLPDDFKNQCTVKLNINGEEKEIKLRLFTVKDEISVSEFEKQTKNSWLYRYALSIVDSEMNMVEKMEFLAELDSLEMLKIRAFHEVNDHGPIMKSKYECPSCGGSGVVPVPFRIEMVFPFGDALKEYTGKTV